MLRIMVLVTTLALSQFALSNEAHNLLSGKSAQEQAFFLGYAARSAGMDCPDGSARKPFFQGFDSAQSAYWNITCGNEAYTVMLENDAQGSSSAMPCSVLKSIGIVCYTKLD